MKVSRIQEKHSGGDAKNDVTAKSRHSNLIAFPLAVLWHTSKCIVPCAILLAA